MLTLYFTESDLVTLKIPMQTFLVLNSRKAIFELLEARSGNYSDRPQTVMAPELCVSPLELCAAGRELTGNSVGWSGTIVVSNNTRRFRACRKLMRKGLGPSAVRSFTPFLQRQSPFLLAALVENPNNYEKVFKR